MANITVVSPPNRFKTINGQSIIGTGNITIGGGGGTIDSALNGDSTNPVQNKVVTNALNSKQDKSSAFTLDGKDGAVSFETLQIEGATTTEFVVDSNKVFKRNVHIYQHNVSIINSSDKTYINIPFLSTFANAITSGNTLCTIINAWLGASVDGEGIPVTGVIKNGTLDHQYVCLLKGQAAGTTSLKFVGMQSNGTTTDLTLADSSMTTVLDKVLLLI